MKNLLKSWLFFTSLMLFLIAFALVLPQLLDGLLGNTEQKLAEATQNAQSGVQAVFALLDP